MAGWVSGGISEGEYQSGAWLVQPTFAELVSIVSAGSVGLIYGQWLH